MFDPNAPCVLVEPSPSMLQCMERYDPKVEWSCNSISADAQFRSCGLVARRGAKVKHDHDPQELAHCHTLATEAADIMGPCLDLLRSGSDPDTQPFFIAAQRGAKVPSGVDEDLIRTAMGGTLHPDARATIEPFAEGTEWWELMLEDAAAFTDSLERLRAWQELMSWFPANSLAHASFVDVRESVDQVHYTIGCVFPRFIIGITDKGSLVGLMTHIVT